MIHSQSSFLRDKIKLGSFVWWPWLKQSSFFIFSLCSGLFLVSTPLEFDSSQYFLDYIFDLALVQEDFTATQPSSTTHGPHPDHALSPGDPALWTDVIMPCKWACLFWREHLWTLFFSTHIYWTWRSKSSFSLSLRWRLGNLSSSAAFIPAWEKNNLGTSTIPKYWPLVSWYLLGFLSCKCPGHTKAMPYLKN